MAHHGLAHDAEADESNSRFAHTIFHCCRSTLVQLLLPENLPEFLLVLSDVLMHVRRHIVDLQRQLVRLRVSRAEEE